MMNTIDEHVHEAATATKKAMRETKTKASEQIVANPLLAVAVCVMVGFVIGRWLR